MIVFQHEVRFVIQQCRDIAVSLINDGEIAIVFLFDNDECLSRSIIRHTVEPKLCHAKFAGDKLKPEQPIEIAFAETLHFFFSGKADLAQFLRLIGNL